MQASMPSDFPFPTLLCKLWLRAALLLRRTYWMSCIWTLCSFFIYVVWQDHTCSHELAGDRVAAETSHACVCPDLTAERLCTSAMLCRLPGILELATLSVRTLIAERTEEEDRARQMGYIGVCLGIGFAVWLIVPPGLAEVGMDACNLIMAMTAIEATRTTTPARLPVGQLVPSWIHPLRMGVMS